MIRTPLSPEPARFDGDVRKPGRTWLDSHPEGRPKDYWRRVSSDLADAFRDRCAYTAMHVMQGTVDHFVSVDEDRTQAYEWRNYRLAAGWINSCKNSVPSSAILDPCEIEDGWFALSLPSLQVLVTDRCPPELRARAEATLLRLHLRDDERVIRHRAMWLAMYRQGKITLDGLEDVAPLLARALRYEMAT